MRKIDGKRTVLVLGSNGMAGHVVTKYLEAEPSLHVINVARRPLNERTVVADAADPTALGGVIKDAQPELIINCIGILIKKANSNPREAIQMNSLLPHVLVDMCDRHGGRLVHLSTDCVFSGKNGPYDLHAFRDGDTVYDRTKALGEVVNERDLTIRTSITGPELQENGTGLFHWFMMQQGPIKGYNNAYWSGVITTELARYVKEICLGNEKAKGIVHYSVDGGINKFDLLNKFNASFSKKLAIESFAGEKVDKRLIPSKGLARYPPSYDQQISDMRDWVHQHRQLYPHYFQGGKTNE
jgi:dTDP-4-dehydrorhamnose reductase